MSKPRFTAKVRRGLKWFFDQGYADYESAEDEFDAKTKSEIETAAAWLRSVTVAQTAADRPKSVIDEFKSDPARKALLDKEADRLVKSARVTCPRCGGGGINFSASYLGGSAQCLLCRGHGQVIPRGDGSYQRITPDRENASE
jgi:hypothetical protein